MALFATELVGRSNGPKYGPGISSAFGSPDFVRPSRRHAIAKCLLALIAVAPLSGCTFHHPIQIDPTLMSNPGTSGRYKLTGKVLVLMDSDDAERITFIEATNRGANPDSWTSLDIPLGAFAVTAATLAFGEVFTDGARWSPTQLDGYAVVVRPSVSSFSYHWELPFWGPNVMVMEVTTSVSITDTAGNVIWAHSYQSGEFKDEPDESTALRPYAKDTP